MSKQIRDLICASVHVQWDVACSLDDFPACPECGGGVQVCWQGGQAPATDVYGVEQYSDATGRMETSTRGKESYMKGKGFYPAGDRVGGALHTHRLNGTTYSYGGQSSRRTVAEG